MLSQSFEQMLSVGWHESQELHHSADRHFSHNFQRFTLRFYLISAANGTQVGAI
jgi:hypothetical protein